MDSAANKNESPVSAGRQRSESRARGASPNSDRPLKGSGDSDAASSVPWREKTAPNRVRPRECVREARDALNRAYGMTDRAPVPLLIEALDWLRRALEQMAPDDEAQAVVSTSHLVARHGDACDL